MTGTESDVGVAIPDSVAPIQGAHGILGTGDNICLHGGLLSFAALRLASRKRGYTHDDPGKD
jgi:hypothetical protein